MKGELAPQATEGLHLRSNPSTAKAVPLPLQGRLSKL